jgi:hypothetical protein
MGSKTLILLGEKTPSPGDLLPGTHGEHASKEGVGVCSVHGCCMLFDARLVTKHERPPQPSILPPEASKISIGAGFDMNVWTP